MTSQELGEIFSQQEKSYSIWMTGFMCQGMDRPEPASCLGTYKGSDFLDACRNMSKDPKFLKGYKGYYNEESNTVYGCALFDNSYDASNTIFG